jgi:predicted DNA-binding transcriptional regulator AlpA
MIKGGYMVQEVKNRSRARGRDETLQNKKFYRLNHILELYPIGPATIWRRVKIGTFPKPIKLGENITAWKAEDLDEFDLDPMNYRAKEVI